MNTLSAQKNNHTGALAGGVIAAVVVLAILAAALFKHRKNLRRAADLPSSWDMAMPPEAGSTVQDDLVDKSNPFSDLHAVVPNASAPMVVQTVLRQVSSDMPSKTDGPPVGGPQTTMQGDSVGRSSATRNDLPSNPKISLPSNLGSSLSREGPLENSSLSMPLSLIPMRSPAPESRGDSQAAVPANAPRPSIGHSSPFEFLSTSNTTSQKQRPISRSTVASGDLEVCPCSFCSNRHFFLRLDF
jgi:hypothetical protein